jgi:predicted phage terminase large subunit-like protein
MADDLRKAWGVKQSAAERAEADRRDRERVARIQRASEDPGYFCQYYLPHYFTTPLAPFQEEIISDAETEQRLGVAAPRGHGKTTLLSFALTLRDIVLQRTRFTIYVGPTWSDAVDRIEEIRLEIENNERIREDFGDLLVGEDKQPRGQKQDDLRLTNGARIMARGCGQSLRGKREKAVRPDRVILDDVDRDEESANPQRIEKRIRWFRRVVLGLEGADGMRVLVVGNIIGRNTLLTWCLDEKRTSWCRKIYRAIQPDGSVLMPGLWTLAKLEAKREEVGNDAFETEYNNNPPSEGSRLFQSAWQQHRWAPEQLATADPGIITALDLSKGKNERSDFQAFVSVRRDAKGNIYILKADIKRRTRKELAERAFTYSEALGLKEQVAFVVESNGFQEWFAEGLDELSAARGMDLPIVQVTHSVSKFDRVAKLSPIAEGGRLLFPPEDQEDENIRILRQQLELFPDDIHDDGPDTLAMAIEESARRRRGPKVFVAPMSPFDREAPAGAWDWRERAWPEEYADPRKGRGR